MQYGPKIVTDSLVLALDAADNNSAPHNDLPVKQGCVTWLDGADDDVFSYSSGTLVSQWRDKSGNDNHVSQSTTSSQPTRNRTLNSKSVVDFDGSDDSLSSSNSLTLSSGHTMFAVTLTDAFSSDAGLISINNNLSNGITVHTGGLVYFYYGSGGYNTTQGVNLSTSYILTKVWTGATSGNRISYKNGTQGTSSGTMANSNSTGVLRLGQQTTYYNGYIAEVVIYNRELSQDEITKVHNYLQNKWNIPVSDTKWYDQTANAYNGTPTNDPTYSETNKGYFEFDGSDQYIDLGNLGLGSGSFTVEAVIYPTLASTYHVFFRKGDDSTSNDNMDWSMGYDYDQFHVRAQNASVAVNEYAGGSFINNYGHVALTYNGSTIRMYLNGSQVSSKNVTLANSYSNYSIGRGINNYADLNVAMIRVYNQTLSAAEILQNYNATKARFT